MNILTKKIGIKSTDYYTDNIKTVNVNFTELPKLINDKMRFYSIVAIFIIFGEIITKKHALNI